MRPLALGVIGLGAIGGSVAWQAVRAGVRRVVGYSPDPEEAAAAAGAGAVTHVAPTVADVLADIELLVIAAPPAATLSQLCAVADQLRSRNVLCTDVSSVKAPVARLAQRLELASLFAGSHPLAGTHRSGFAGARAELFRNATVYITPAGEDRQVAGQIARFWSDTCGAVPVLIDAGKHDALVAWTSHLPQAAASALAATFLRAAPAAGTYGSGARDTTRLAASSPEMWRDILMMNREAVLIAMDGLEDQLGELRRALTTADAAALEEWLRQACEWRRDLES